MKKFLVRHLGNMGDFVFLIPPVLEALKKHYPNCHITLVAVWGFKNRHGIFGERNQDGACVHLAMTNPNVDRLVHWHDTKCAPKGGICEEDGRSFPTWNRDYYEKQKQSGGYDGVYELDFGLKCEENPIKRMFAAIDLPQAVSGHYKIYLTDSDMAVARAVIANAPRPRIVLLESLEGLSTRSWDAGKIPALAAAINNEFGVEPYSFGGKYTPEYQGRRLSLRENIATLTQADVGVGVLSGPLHFAAAVGLPTLTLSCEQPLRRAIPAFFLNDDIADAKKKHRTLLGPSGPVCSVLKDEKVSAALTPAEARAQGFKTWQRPGRQATKSCLATITVDEIMAVLRDMLA